MRRVMVGLGLAGLAGGLALLALVVTGGDDDARPVGDEVPDSYRIEYRVVTGDAEATDVVTVRRPFDSRLETETGDGPPSRQIGSFARLRQDGGRGAPSVVAVPPGPAPSDVRLDAVVAAGVERGLLAPRGEREIAGRPCRVYRSGALLTTGVLTPPGDREYADTCVDPVGLVLDEELVVGGETVLRRTATRVELEPRVDDGAFATGAPTIGAADGGGSVLPLTPGTGRPGSFWTLDDPPPGFVSCGRFSVVPPQPAPEVGVADDRVASVAQVFVRGRDVLIVDQGATLGGGSPFELGAGEPADLGPLGDGELVLLPTASEARAVLPAGGYVRVVATLPPEELVAAARRLREIDGGDRLHVEEDEEPVCRSAPGSG